MLFSLFLQNTIGAHYEMHDNLVKRIFSENHSRQGFIESVHEITLGVKITTQSHVPCHWFKPYIEDLIFYLIY